MTAKIIDLGLAKAVNEPGSRRALSTPGGSAGTLEFASPEQFARSRSGHPLRSVLARARAMGDGIASRAVPAPYEVWMLFFWLAGEDCRGHNVDSRCPDAPEGNGTL